MSAVSSVRPPWALLAVCALLYLPFAAMGYGSDPDGYGLVSAGRRMVEDGVYDMSRHPGYLVVEATTGVLGALARGAGLPASLAINLGTLAMTLVAVLGFHAALVRLAVPRPTWLAAGLALHPLVWPVAATPMDYGWALGLLMVGWVLLLDRRWAWAGVVLGLAVGARFTSALMVPLLVAHVAWTRPGDRRGALGALLLATALGAACYLPALGETGGTLAFLRPSGMGGPELWTPGLRLGRFGFKNIHAWGPVGMLALLGTAAWALVRRRTEVTAAEWRPLVGLALSVVAAYELLFLAFPLEAEYLIPMLPFTLVLLGLALGRRPAVLAVVLALVVLHNGVALTLARPDRAYNARGASVGLWVEPGLLVADVRMRLRLRHCETFACASAAYEAGGPR